MKAFLDRYSSPNLIGVDFDLERQLSQQQIDDLMISIAGVQAYYPNLRYIFIYFFCLIIITHFFLFSPVILSPWQPLLLRMAL